MTERPTVLVLGGGLIGLATAYYLNKSGYAVRVLEKGRIGGECSHGNCGLITPSHVLPLAEPGTIRYAISAALRRSPALRIRLRWDLRLWKWLWNFSRRCNRDDMIEAAGGINALLKSSHHLYHDIIEEEKLDCEWQRQGLYFVYQDQHKLDEYEPTNELLTTQFNEPAIKIDSKELQQREPTLVKSLAGAWYFETDTHLRPSRLVSAWHRLLKERGVEFVEHCEVKEIRVGNGSVQSIIANQGEFTANEYVVALGSWTPLLTQAIGIECPIQPGKGYSITMKDSPVKPNSPMIFPQHRVAVTPFEQGLRLGSMMEFAGYDTSIQEKRLAHLTNTAQLYFQNWKAGPIEEKWYGWRPMTYDSVPIIGRAPQHKNLTIAAGHNMLGLSMAPATGKLVTEIIAGTSPHVDTKPYTVTRF